MTITLRPALPFDIDALWALRTVAVRVSCATHYAPEQIAAWTASPVPPAYAAMLAAGGGIVAMQGDIIAGYAMLDADKQEVDAVFVDPALAGLGIGKRLLAALEQLARGRGIARLHLSASLNAVPFYAAAGFTALREQAYAHPSGISLSSVAMEKALTPA
ncbi:GNAT family N-acetyltransferase [Janthinobacterium lividum]|uniref:GNAT family N-acetyltransferase n=1 Tax=Janthinobacterium lividum TaxID=29581 RepID=UPI000873C37E|nr:GNAT family N-acetyltransferase [Janthinobacterium lividum]MCC7712103.1 GNAT family N-acetyltransferase [Janthinobacterium lividum]OEZ53847.1 putative N-acetyltransferase YafP [Janthinobacterium lividum]WQE27213.1 GNAT family N-acetyltransferase [Janthinobacterium lividum]STQ98106.1 putative acyltransferase [Janthinobacterium lividum]